MPSSTPPAGARAPLADGEPRDPAADEGTETHVLGADPVSGFDPVEGADPVARAAPRRPRVGTHSGWLLAVCCLAQFMVILDLSIVNVALPRSSPRSASPRPICCGSSTPT